MSQSEAERRWALHRDILGGVSSASGATLPLTLDKSPQGAQAAHHGLACYDALRRGKPMPARPTFLDASTAEKAEAVAKQHAAPLLDLAAEYTFGQAIDLVWAGHRMEGTAWNGKGMYIFAVFGSFTPTGTDPTASITNAPESLPVAPSVYLRSADGTLVPWAPNNLDMRMKWRIVSAATIGPPGQPTPPPPPPDASDPQPQTSR